MTKTKEEILRKHNIYQNAANDAIGVIVLRAMQKYSDQENARLTAIVSK